MKCRSCKSNDTYCFINLGFAPPSNSYLNQNQLSRPEIYYPLRVHVCKNCWLVQTEDFAKVEELFSNNYAYFSSASKTWLSHASQFCRNTIRDFKLTNSNFVIEIASNDGYLLKNFFHAGVPCLGIEPTESTALECEKKGIKVIKEFFGTNLANRIIIDFPLADVVIANNVLAHVPDINDFVAGLAIILNDGGVISVEFPHLLRLLQQNQFDTIYHEHFSYLSFKVVCKIFDDHGLTIWNVEQLDTHGGSLRVFAGHKVNSPPIMDSVFSLNKLEDEYGMCNITVYEKFQQTICSMKNDFLQFLLKCKYENKKVVGFGAAAKGNTLLNFSGVGPDLIEVIFDSAESKQSMFSPGAHIPILAPELLNNFNPDIVIIFPWNIATEIKELVSHILGRKPKFYIAIPKLLEI